MDSKKWENRTVDISSFAIKALKFVVSCENLLVFFLGGTAPNMLSAYYFAKKYETEKFTN